MANFNSYYYQVPTSASGAQNATVDHGPIMDPTSMSLNQGPIMHTVMSVPQNATAIPGAMMDTWGWLDPNPHTLQDERPPDPFGAGPLSIGASAEASSGNAVSEYIQKLGQDLMDRFDRIEMQVEGMREIGEQNKNTVDQLNERVEELNKTVEQLHEGVRKLNKTAEQLNDVVEQSNKGMISRIESIERSFEDVMNRMQTATNQLCIEVEEKRGELEEWKLRADTILHGGGT